MKSPAARSLQYLRDQGHHAQIVEKWLGHARRRIDLFGFIDIVSLDVARNQIVGVQSTTSDHVWSHKEKILTECEELARRWLQCGAAIEIHGWKKYKKRLDGKVWRPVVRRISLRDFASL